MSWNYSENPAASLRDEVRYRIGDTNRADPQLSDEEIAWELSREGNSALVAATNCVKALIARYSREVNKSIGGLSISAGERVRQYKELLSQLQDEACEYPIPYAGGISETDKQIDEENEDRVRPAFARELMDNPDLGANVYDPESQYE